MKDNSRCSCGSRWFSASPVIVTCVDGRGFQLDSVKAVRCLECGKSWIYPALWKHGKKRLLEGEEAWDLLGEAANRELRNDREGDPPFHLSDPADRLESEVH